MESCLNIHNKHAVRKEGLALLLTFMEVLADQMEEQVRILCLPSRSVGSAHPLTVLYDTSTRAGSGVQVVRFALAIPYEPFLRPEEEKSEATKPAEQDKRKRLDVGSSPALEGSCLAPAFQSPTRSDAVDLTKFYFEFISSPAR